MTVKTTSKYSVFTVNNYNLYQDNDTQNDVQTTGERHSNDILSTGERHSIDSLTTTIEERKESKKGRSKEGKKEKKEGTNVPKKKEPAVYYPNDERLNQTLDLCGPVVAVRRLDEDEKAKLNLELFSGKQIACLTNGEKRNDAKRNNRKEQ